MSLSHNDGGYRSRKWIGFLIACVLILVAGKLIVAASIAAVVTGIVGVYTAFCAGNVSRDYAALKHGATIAPPTSVKEAIKDVVDAVKEAPKEEEGS